MITLTATPYKKVLKRKLELLALHSEGGPSERDKYGVELRNERKANNLQADRQNAHQPEVQGFLYQEYRRTLSHQTKN